jgi:UTP:GlnB (protein PII) uridylyltransferase
LSHPTHGRIPLPLRRATHSGWHKDSSHDNVSPNRVEGGGKLSGQFPIGAAESVRVRFVDSDDGALTVLEIENPREQQVIGEVRHALHAAGVEVQSVEIRVDQERAVGRLRVTESDGSPLGPERHLQIQDKVLKVVLGWPLKARDRGLGAEAASS